MNKTATVVTIVGGVIAFLGAQFWGVPYYVRSVARAEVKVILAEVSDPAGIGTNEANIGAVLTRLDSIEARMIARDKLFMEYLERQAAR